MLKGFKEFLQQNYEGKCNNITKNDIHRAFRSYLNQLPKEEIIDLADGFMSIKGKIECFEQMITTKDDEEEIYIALTENEILKEAE